MFMRLSRLFAFYSRCLSKHPLGTQMISAGKNSSTSLVNACWGVIGVGGDCFSQFVIEQKHLKDYDTKRGTRFFILPAFYIAPILSQWFKVLERVVVGNPKFVPLKRVIIDQLFFAPPFSASIIFGLHLLEGQSVKNAFQRLKAQFLDIYKRSVTYWPIVQLFNFYLIPLNMRVVIVQIAAFAWNSFLSYKTNQPGIILPPLE